jgi:actin related protein 2/3 complex subunit 1A/1B
LYICSVDWHPETNRIISASHDRNIFVWVKTDNKWIPQLVNIKTKVGVLQVKWSKDGDKFVGCTNKKLAIGFWYEYNKYWECKYIGKLCKSAITCSTFDESGLFVIVGGTDSRAYIVSSFIEEVDSTKTLNNLPFDIVVKFLI